MKQSELKDPNFWIALRERTSLNGRIGIEECSLWCNEALKMLGDYRKHRFRKVESTVSHKTIGKYGLFVDTHRVLARKYPEGIFIADGTAGQVDTNYPLGYYGFVHNASKRLSLFYEKGHR